MVCFFILPLFWKLTSISGESFDNAMILGKAVEQLSQFTDFEYCPNCFLPKEIIGSPQYQANLLTMVSREKVIILSIILWIYVNTTKWLIRPRPALSSILKWSLANFNFTMNLMAGGEVGAPLYRTLNSSCALSPWAAVACVAGGIVSARAIKFWTSERRSREENGESDSEESEARLSKTLFRGRLQYRQLRRLGQR